MAYRVLLSDSLGPEGLARLREQPDLEVDARPGLSPAELREVIGEYDALVVRSATKVTADVIARADRLRVIGRAGIGVDNIDVDAATDARHRGDEHARRQQRHHGRARHRHAARAGAQHPAGDRVGARGQVGRSTWIGTEVCNKTLGIVGLGNIGRIVAERALGLR